MNIYRIIPQAEDNYSFLEEHLLSREESFKLLLGQKVETIKEKAELKNKTKKIPDITGNGTYEIYVNDKIKNILFNQLENINYLQTSLSNYKYWLINIIGHLDCFDYENSEFTVFDNGKPDKITKAKFHLEKIPEIGVFRIKEKPVPLFITEKLKNIFEEAGVTGVKYSDNMDLTMGI